jgi:hypothetical protein
VAERATGGNFFIVDNSISGWTGLRYLRERCGIANGLDIATGFFEIGGLLELDGEWQKIQKIHVLMGDEVSRRSRQALLEAVRRRAQVNLDASIEEEKAENSFLGGVATIVEALQTGRIECRIYDKEKFHAKTYITDSRLAVEGVRVRLRAREADAARVHLGGALAALAGAVEFVTQGVDTSTVEKQ